MYLPGSTFYACFMHLETEKESSFLYKHIVCYQKNNIVWLILTSCFISKSKSAGFSKAISAFQACVCVCVFSGHGGKAEITAGCSTQSQREPRRPKEATRHRKIKTGL